MDHARRTRSTLPRADARRRYVELGKRAVLEQIRLDARLLEDQAIAIGPFARLDAGAVAAREGKTRGALTNVFGSQAGFQVATMEHALDAGDRIAGLAYPAPGDFAGAEAWLDALLLGQSERGPRHGAEPDGSYAFLWALWLGTLPYGLWSERIARPSLDEFVQWAGQLETALAGAVGHFGLAFRAGTTAADLALALGSLIEGFWLNQCLAAHNPFRPAQPIAEALCHSGRLLWRGAIESP